MSDERRCGGRLGRGLRLAGRERGSDRCRRDCQQHRYWPLRALHPILHEEPMLPAGTSRATLYPDAGCGRREEGGHRRCLSAKHKRTYGATVPISPLLSSTGGEAGIRTQDQGLSPDNGLANRRFRPLSHLSALERYLRVATDPHAGREPRSPTLSADAVTVKHSATII